MKDKGVKYMLDFRVFYMQNVPWKRKQHLETGIRIFFVKCNEAYKTKKPDHPNDAEIPF